MIILGIKRKNMDREISIEERRKESRKKRRYVGGVFLAVVASVAGLMMLLGESVKENDLLIKKAEPCVA